MSQRLLLVEDEEHLAFALEFNLQQEGYEVDVAFNLRSARDHREARSHDLIILDVMLPDGNGFEFCQEVRRKGDVTPVLFLTAKGTSNDIVAGLDAGGDDYMAKPFALQELLGRVAAMLRRRSWDSGHPPKTAKEIRFGDTIVDCESRQAMVRGKPMDLTDLEFRLLKFFVDNPDRVISREELLEKVWEISSGTNTRTVDIFLVRLRRLFEKDAGRPRHFLTVRGVGYRFTAE